MNNEYKNHHNPVVNFATFCILNLVNHVFVHFLFNLFHSFTPGADPEEPSSVVGTDRTCSSDPAPSLSQTCHYFTITVCNIL